MLRFGVDTICWHAQLASGEVDVATVVDETADAGFAFVQVGLASLAGETGGAELFAERCRDRGLAVRATGGPLGRRSCNSDSIVAADRVRSELDAAAALGSTTLMVYSGAYLPDLLGRPDAISAELEHLRVVLAAVATTAASAGMLVEIENASDFTADQIASVVTDVGAPSVRAFLDLTNPYNVFEHPAEAVARLAPLAEGGHVKDFVLESRPNFDGYHRHGWSLLFRYPGEGVSEAGSTIKALSEAVGDRMFDLSVEGLDSVPGRRDQRGRLAASLAFMRSSAGE